MLLFLNNIIIFIANYLIEKLISRSTILVYVLNIFNYLSAILIEYLEAPTCFMYLIFFTTYLLYFFYTSRDNQLPALFRSQIIINNLLAHMHANINPLLPIAHKSARIDKISILKLEGIIK